jgi:hypothetical protein
MCTKRNCAGCNTFIVPGSKHECYKPFCANCNQNKEIGHFCYMKPLVNELPRNDKVLFVFYDIETTHDTRISESTTAQIPNLVCLQQLCSICEKEPDISLDCARCGERRHAFVLEPVGDLTYLCKQRPWCEKVVAIAHNAKGFDAPLYSRQNHSSKMDSQINFE